MEFGACSGLCKSSQVSSFGHVRSYSQRYSSFSQLSNVSFHFPTSVSRGGYPFKAILNGTTTTTGKVKKMVGARSGGFELELSGLTALSPLDGRYWGKVKELAHLSRKLRI